MRWRPGPPGHATAGALRLGIMTQDEPSERERRAERLAAALKENLRRRKVQARGRAAEDAAGHQPEPRKPAEEGGKP